MMKRGHDVDAPRRRRDDGRPGAGVGGKCHGSVGAGNGFATGRIGRQTPIHVVDAIFTGVHQPGESHFELLEAFASDAVLAKISKAFSKHSYHTHEFGDSLLIERGRTPNRPSAGEWMSPSGEA